MLAALRNRWKLIAVITGCFLLAGIIYALSATLEYRSKAKVLPEINNSPQGGVRQLLQSYGGLLGIGNLGANSAANSQYISPNIYPVIVHSLSFQSAILRDTVYFSDLDTSVTLYQYFSDGKVKAMNLKFSAGGVNIPESIFDSTDISSITGLQMNAIRQMRGRMDITFESSTGVMNVKVTMPDAVAAAQVCSNVIERLKVVVKKYHTRKAQALLDYTNEQYQDARKKFLKAQNKLATFKDEHSNLVTAASQSRLKYLRSKYKLTYNVFNSVAQKRVMAKMNFQRSIPVFNIIQHPNIPLHPYSPKWIPVILISIAVGLVLSFLVVSVLFVFQEKYIH